MANCFHIAYDYTVQDCGPGPFWLSYSSSVPSVPL